MVFFRIKHLSILQNLIITREGCMALNTIPLLVLHFSIVFFTCALEPGEISAQKDTQSQNKWALLVGIDDYLYVKDLHGPSYDVSLIQKLLIDLYGFSKKNIKTLLNRTATRQNILDAFKSHLIANTAENDIAVFYFSGHGSQIPADTPDELDGLHETIVPHDARTPNGEVNDITDDELNKLLGALGGKCKKVTFILDCCHSGTGIRGGGIPKWILPPSPIPSIHERNLCSPQDGWWAGAGANYVLLAACRDDQTAQEISWKNHKVSAFTLGLNHTLRNAFSQTTWRDIKDRLASEIQLICPGQHPQIKGAGLDDLVFGIHKLPTSPYVLVSSSTESFATLKAGHIHGITEGSIFAIYAPATKSFQGDPITEARVFSVGTLDSQVRLLSRVQIPTYARAVERYHNFEGWRLGLYLERDQESHFLKRLREELAAHPVIQVVASKKGMDTYRLKIEHDQNSNRLVLTGNDQMKLKAEFSVDPNKDPSGAIRRILDWAKWFNVLAIQNTRFSERIKVTLSVHGRSEKPSDLVPSSLDLTATAGETVICRIANNYEHEIFATVLDLTSDGGIFTVFPVGEGNQAIPARGQAEISFTAYLPAQVDAIRDIIKIFIAREPIDLDLLNLNPRTQWDNAKNNHGIDNLFSNISRGIYHPKKPLSQENWGTIDRSVYIIK